MGIMRQEVILRRIQYPAEPTLHTMWCSLNWTLQHAEEGRIVFPFMFLPVGLVLEGSVVAAKSTAVLGLCLIGWRSSYRNRLR